MARPPLRLEYVARFDIRQLGNRSENFVGNCKILVKFVQNFYKVLRDLKRRAILVFRAKCKTAKGAVPHELY